MLNAGPLTSVHIHNIYREIISSCLSLETNLSVSFLGRGTYSEIAMNKFLGKASSQIAEIIFLKYLMMLKIIQVNLVWYS